MNRVAPDQWPLIEAFRANGAMSFHRLGVAAAREAYEASCARNGLPTESVDTVTDLILNGDPDVAVRLYKNGIDHDAPVVLFVHGGGWVMGSLSTHDTLCRYLARRSGCAILAVDYRLAPEHVYPAALDDVRTALTWIHTDGRDHGLDPDRIVVIGDSAGGHLAAEIARADRTITAQVLLYPVTSASIDTKSHRDVVDGFPLTTATMEWFLHLYSGGDTSTAVRDLTVQPRPLPTFVCTGGHDPLASGGAALARSRVDYGALVHHIHLPEHAHGLFTSAGSVGTGRQILTRVCEFISAATDTNNDAERSATML